MRFLLLMWISKICKGNEILRTLKYYGLLPFIRREELILLLLEPTAQKIIIYNRLAKRKKKI